MQLEIILVLERDSNRGSLLCSIASPDMGVWLDFIVLGMDCLQLSRLQFNRMAAGYTQDMSVAIAPLGICCLASHCRL